MKRQATSVLAASLVVFGQAAPLLAHQRGSVSGASRGTYSKSGNTGSWQSRSGNASGSRTVSQTSEGYNVNKQVQTQSGASKEVNKDINTEDKSVERSSTATNQYGQTASRERTVQGEGGYATVEGSGSTSTGRSYEGQGAVGRNAYGQPVAAGSVNTKYSGSYAGAAAKNPYGGWNTAVAGPYGGKVTTTLPSGYKTTSYYGRPYYSYGGAYYRPYSYGGVYHYYPVPPPYYAYYQTPPTGAIILMVAGATYLMSQGNYSKKTTSSEGTVVYQSVPAPQGATLTTLPVERALVTVAGTTYFLYSNTFYRRVPQGASEQFVVVSPPAGAVFVAALPADFQVVQLNTMYFMAGGKFYIPYLATDGKELYALVDTPPQPSAAAGGPAGAPTAPPPSAPPPVRTVSQSLSVPAGTVLLVRLQADLTSATAKPGDRFQGFLEQDLAANGRLVAAHGTRVYGVVSSVDPGDKMKGKPKISATLTDLQVGDHVTTIQTQPVSAQGEAGKGGKKILGGAALGAAIGGIADGGDGAAVGAAVGGGVGMLGAAAGSPNPAVLAAQAPHAFTVAAPFQVDVMTNVAVR